MNSRTSDPRTISSRRTPPQRLKIPRRIYGRSHGNCNDDNTPPFSPVHTRECDSKGATRRRWLEHSRSRESSSGILDRFTMEEPLRVHQRTEGNHRFPFSKVVQGVRLPAHQV